MVTVRELFEFVERHHIPLDCEIAMIRTSTDRVNGIEVEAIAVTGLNLTAQGLLRIDIF